jgi:hypothetical protein
MIVFDLINDEAPLFIEGLKVLFTEKVISFENVLGVTEGTRWKEESKAIKNINRLSFFDDLDKKNIDLEKELHRLSRTYENNNIYGCDRYLIQKEKDYQKKMLVYTYLFYESLFKKNVTHYFTTGIAFTYNLVSYQVSKRFNVEHVSFYGTRIENKTAICLDNKNSFGEVDTLFGEFHPSKVTKEMYALIEGFVKAPKQPYYMNNAINALAIKPVFIKEFFIRFKKYYLEDKHKYDLFTRNPFELTRIKLKKMLLTKSINFRHDAIFEKVNYLERYFIYPIHMQPEASTLVQSPFQIDQKAAIINISRLLPLNTVLYVKEHRSALGKQSIAFYKELKQHPNIKLISYRENMFELINNSIGTINLTSTAGFESLFFKKPSIVLGDVFYNKTGLTFKVNSFPKLEKVIKMVSEKGFKVDEHFEHYDAKLAYYIYCLNKKSYSFEFNVAKLDTKERVLREENVQEFSDCVKSIHRRNQL